MATLTINTTPAQDARIIDAYGKSLGLVDAGGDPRNATGAEVKASVINSIKQVVFDQERKALVDAVSVSDLDPV